MRNSFMAVWAAGALMRAARNAAVSEPEVRCRWCDQARSGNQSQGPDGKSQSNNKNGEARLGR